MPEGRRTTPPKAREAARIRMLHVDGRAWTVREEATSLADRRSGASLIFESPSLIRRVRHYPPNWYDLADDALFAVSFGT